MHSTYYMWRIPLIRIHKKLINIVARVYIVLLIKNWHNVFQKTLQQQHNKHSCLCLLWLSCHEVWLSFVFLLATFIINRRDPGGTNACVARRMPMVLLIMYSDASLMWLEVVIASAANAASFPPQMNMGEVLPPLSVINWTSKWLGMKQQQLQWQWDSRNNEDKATIGTIKWPWQWEKDSNCKQREIDAITTMSKLRGGKRCEVHDNLTTTNLDLAIER